MSKKGRTPDEKFLIELYQMVHEKEDPFTAVDCREIGTRLRQKQTALKNIIKHLAQANLIKKLDEMMIVFTQRGWDFVCDELSKEV